MSSIALLTDEAKKEVRSILNSRKYYVSGEGKMFFSAANDVNTLVLASITE